jgi:hypothetical protein
MVQLHLSNRRTRRRSSSSPVRRRRAGGRLAPPARLVRRQRKHVHAQPSWVDERSICEANQHIGAIDVRSYRQDRPVSQGTGCFVIVHHHSVAHVQGIPLLAQHHRLAFGINEARHPPQTHQSEIAVASSPVTGKVSLQRPHWRNAESSAASSPDVCSSARSWVRSSAGMKGLLALAAEASSLCAVRRSLVLLQPRRPYRA